jgi:chromosome segregation ATPase
MFWVKEFEVVHWAFWQREKLVFNRSLIGLFGHNGSGKTSFLDAIRTAFGIECAADRNYQHYLRTNKQPYAWIRAVLPNEPHNGVRPFRSITRPVITVFCKISQSGQGTWHRDYLIAEGEHDIEWAETVPKESWMGVKHYRQQLEGAGLTREISNVMRIPQDQTSKLAEMTPAKLLDLVLDVRGDKQPLEAWREARQNQIETQRTLKRVEVDRDLTDARVKTLTADADSYRKFERLTKERQAIVAERLPQAEYQQYLSNYQRTSQFVAEDFKNLSKLRRELADETASLRTLEEQLIAVRKEFETALATSNTAAGNHGQAEAALEACENALRDRDRLRMQVQRDASGDDPEAAREEVLEEMSRLRARIAELTFDSRRVSEQLTQMPQGKPPSPRDVQAFTAALDEAGIQYRTLPEVIEVTDPKWSAALEGVLAANRHIILLARERDGAAADALGERMGYRHYIVDSLVDARTPSRGSLLEKLTVTGKVPGWVLSDLDGITCVETVADGHKLGKGGTWITPQAFHRSSRGGRSRLTTDSVFSAGGRQRTREQLIARSKTISEEIRRLEKDVQLKEQESSRLAKLVAGINAAIQLDAQKERFAEAERALPELRKMVGIRLEERNDARDILSDASNRQSSAITDQSNTQSEVKRVQRAIGDLHHDFRGRRASQRREIQNMKRLRKGPFAALFTSEALEKADRSQSFDRLKARLATIEDDLASDTLVKDPTVLDSLAVAQADLKTKTALLEAKNAELGKAVEGTITARADYIKIVRRTVAQYEKSVKKLAEPAGIEVTFDPMQFGSDDDPTANSGLKVNPTFHGKEQSPDGMASLSGGQKVVFSMILLLALLGDDRPNAMFFIDEPFAHLDNINVELVAKFLDETPGQFLITIPETENPQVFERLGVVYCTRLRKPKMTWAPRIVLAERAAGERFAA